MALSAIDLEIHLEISSLIAGVDKITDRRTAAFDSLAQDLSDAGDNVLPVST